ncbi:hypothetical protein HH212_22050 [Massilia forsythiae]|uniref:Uncharacterized protein n=1 Tax=Massilia forsythiae TaxID=2728020 RepID=A0A7Z2W079_9BURK|nr:hypothetical protein [Massilia forsythiae]QJE02373.1 hypothetical protein HH212_22050 [Massilia forsythiae]
MSRHVKKLLVHYLGLFSAASAAGFLCNHYMGEPHASALLVVGLAFVNSTMGILQIACHDRLSGRWK